MNERTLPNSFECETTLIGSLVMMPKVIPDAATMLTAQMFFSPANAVLFEALTDVARTHGTVDSSLLTTHLRDSGQLAELGGVDRIVEIVESVGTPFHWRHHAEQVRRLWQCRELIRICDEAVEASYERPVDATETIERHEAAVFGLRSNAGRQDQEEAAADTMDDLLAEIDEYQDGTREAGLTTGFHELDGYLLNEPGDVVVIGARPSMGKTSAALTLLRSMAIDIGIPAAMCSLEMTTRQIRMRLLSQMADVSTDAMKGQGKLTPTDRQRISEASETIKRSPLMLDGTPGLSLSQLHAKCRRWAENGIRIVMVDYLQLMTWIDPTATAYTRITEISKGIKAIAKECGIVIYLLSQLSRANEQSQDKRPTMSNLRESGGIEQDADVVALLHREDYYHKADTEYINSNELEIIVDKNRGGRTGVVTMKFEGQYTRFSEWLPGEKMIAAPPGGGGVEPWYGNE